MKLSENIKWKVEILIFLTIVIFIILGIIHWTFKLIYLPPYEPEDFNEHKGSFKKIAESFWDEYIPQLKEDQSISYIRIKPGLDELTVYYVTDPDKEAEVRHQPLDEDLLDAFRSVSKALPPDSEGYGSFSEVHISKNQIAFVRAGGPYALIYTKYTRPCFISSKGEDCFTDQISFNWYQVANKGAYPGKEP